MRVIFWHNCILTKDIRVLNFHLLKLLLIAILALNLDKKPKDPSCSKGTAEWLY